MVEHTSVTAISVNLNIKYPRKTKTANIHYAQNDRLRSWKFDTDSQETRKAQAETKAFICMKYCHVCWSMLLLDLLEVENVAGGNHSVYKFLHFPWGGKIKRDKAERLKN